MLPTLRRALLAAALLTTTFATSHAAAVCDQLIPIGLLPPAGGFTIGCAHPFHLNLGASIGPDGNYILLAYPACASGPCAGQTGIALLQCAATRGYFCCVSTTQMVPTLTGNNVGTLATGFNQRLANDTDPRAGICYSDYTGNGARVGNVPMIQFIGTDRTQAQITGFLRLFLVGPPTGTGTATTIPVEFIEDPTPTQGASWGRVKLLYR